jgi:hypothetical protein
MAAAEKGNPECVVLLLDAGAKVDVQNNIGFVPWPNEAYNIECGLTVLLGHTQRRLAACSAQPPARLCRTGGCAGKRRSSSPRTTSTQRR